MEILENKMKQSVKTIEVSQMEADKLFQAIQNMNIAKEQLALAEFHYKNIGEIIIDRYGIPSKNVLEMNITGKTLTIKIKE